MALVTFDAQLAVQQKEAQLEKLRGPTHVEVHKPERNSSGIKFEDTPLYKNMVKTKGIESELVQIRNLIRKRTDPSYECDDDDFNVKPVREFDKKADYYKLLQIDDFASMKDIKGAYKKLVLLYHPDKNRDKKQAQMRVMQEEFEKIQEAYEILSDRATRRQYDRSKFDEARAKNQGLGGIWKEKDGAGDKDNYWSSFAKKKADRVNPDTGKALSPKKMKKTKDMVVELKISLNKALRGGLKILEVDRERLQRAFGAARETAKTFHVPIARGQTQGSELRIPDEGTWADNLTLPGDLVFKFKHKPHPNLKQVPPAHEGNLTLNKPFSLKAKAHDRILSAWTYTFKGQMVVLRFLNPFLKLDTCKACIIDFVLPQEGLPIMEDANERRGSLTVNINLKLDGEGNVASMGEVANQDMLNHLKKRQMRIYNHKPHVRVDFRAQSAAALSIRRYVARIGNVAPHDREIDLPALCFVWEAPAGHDILAFTKAAASLGHHAARNPSGFMWGYHRGWAQRSLPEPYYVSLRDDELDDEDEKEKVAPPPPKKRVKRKHGAKAQFLNKFGLFPKGGLNDPASTDEEDDEIKEQKEQRLLSSANSLSRERCSLESRLGEAEVPMVYEELEGDEEKEITTMIREKQAEVGKLEHKFHARKKRVQSSMQEDEGTLAELLEKDKVREMARIEKEMTGLRSTFEFQLKAENKWMSDLYEQTHWDNEWVVVFKPMINARKEPKVDAPLMRQLPFNTTFKSHADKPTDDGWLHMRDGNAWVLTWHNQHGKLVTKWFGHLQSKFLDVEVKIDGRRQVRNETFLTYKKKRKEVNEWCIPPGPTEEEVRELEDDDGEQLHEILEPILSDIKDCKKRLKELRQKRQGIMLAQAEKDAGGLTADLENRLPKGFSIKQTTPSAASATATPSSAPAAALQEWELKKKDADAAFGKKEWNTAIQMYTQALEAGGAAIPERTKAMILCNRSLVYSKLDEWTQSLNDASEAVFNDSTWPKGWLRRATAELRLLEPKKALSSLKRGLPVADKLTSQFLPLITECEAALYTDFDESVSEPRESKERIEVFRDRGSKAFGEKQYGLAILHYTRCLYHRSMMENFAESQVISNRSAAFLSLSLASEALSDALLAAEKHPQWPKPLIRAGQAAQVLQDFKASYNHFAAARRIEKGNTMACEGVNNCLQKIVAWDYPAAIRRWSRFTVDRHRKRDKVRIWALSDIFFDEGGAPEWCKSLSSSFYRDDILLLAGNIAGGLTKVKYGLTVLKSKFRRVFFVPGNMDMWIRKNSLMSIIKGGEKVEDETQKFGDSVCKLLELLHACDELGVETSPAEVAEGVFVAPLFSWYSRDFVSRELRNEKASQADAGAKITIDQNVKWPFGCESEDAWKFFMRMNEASLRAILVAKSGYEEFSGQQAAVLTMTHFLPRPDLKFDWTVPGIWDHIGCSGLDEQIRAIGSTVHVYGRACKGGPVTQLDGVSYVHNFLGKLDDQKEDFAPYCVYDKGNEMPSQPFAKR